MSRRSSRSSNGDVDAGVTWADGQGDWEDGYNSGALRKAVDSGIVDMNDIVEIWKSKPIPEGPIVLRRALPADVKTKMVDLLNGLHAKDKDCAYKHGGRRDRRLHARSRTTPTRP